MYLLASSSATFNSVKYGFSGKLLFLSKILL